MEKKYWAFIKKTIRGPFTAKEISQIPGFNEHTLICPENKLGQWKEAKYEENFIQLIESPHKEIHEKAEIAKAKEMENAAIKKILEKAINKNAQLENEVRKIKKEYELQKKNFVQTIEKKDLEIKALTEKIKNLSSKLNLSAEHPSWEMLYKELKRKSEKAIEELQKENAQRLEEINKTKNQMQNIINKYEEIKNITIEKHNNEIASLKNEITNLKNIIEEKEIIISTMEENLSSAINKANEFQKILIEERNEYENKSKAFCEEIGKLKADIKWKDEEIEKLRTELKEALIKLKEIESIDEIKTKEQDELFKIIHQKIKILTDYFENLESKLRFKKAES